MFFYFTSTGCPIRGKLPRPYIYRITKPIAAQPACKASSPQKQPAGILFYAIRQHMRCMYPDNGRHSRHKGSIHRTTPRRRHTIGNKKKTMTHFHTSRTTQSGQHHKGRFQPFCQRKRRGKYIFPPHNSNAKKSPAIGDDCGAHIFNLGRYLYPISTMGASEGTACSFSTKMRVTTPA